MQSRKNNLGENLVSLSLRNILFGTIIILVSTVANAASVTLVDLANSQNRGGFAAGFYTLKIDGTNVLAMCDDFSTNSTINETWTGNFNTQADINGGAGKFQPSPGPVAYHQAGYLFSLTSSADYSHQASIDQAIWKIMDASAPALSGDAANYYSTATGGAYDTFDYSNVMRVLTPVPPGASQEFLVAVPLPSALWLLFSGMAGLFSFARRPRQEHTS
jgi:hypothetical protein